VTNRGWDGLSIGDRKADLLGEIKPAIRSRRKRVLAKTR